MVRAAGDGESCRGVLDEGVGKCGDVGHLHVKSQKKAGHDTDAPRILDGGGIKLAETTRLLFSRETTVDDHGVFGYRMWWSFNLNQHPSLWLNKGLCAIGIAGIVGQCL